MIRGRAPVSRRAADRSDLKVERSVVPRYVRGVLALRRALVFTPSPDALDLAPLTSALAAGVEEAIKKPALEAVHAAYAQTMRKISESALDQLALEWIHSRSLELANRLGAEQRQVIREVLDQAVRENLSPPDILARLRSVVGLTRESARALTRWEREARAAGVAPDVIERESIRRANKAVRSRATTIARTEMSAARNNATMDAWRAQQAAGELSPNTQKIWMPRDGCPICQDLEALGPIPLNAVWQHGTGSYSNPPAHPNCKCALGLVFPD
jgi:hypothetical protein